MFVKKLEHIQRLLKFVEQRKIKGTACGAYHNNQFGMVLDELTVREIRAFRYELATYRALFGVGKTACFDSHSQWPAFIENRNHFDYFEDFCRRGLVVEAVCHYLSLLRS
jgi:hypothetical protein